MADSLASDPTPVSQTAETSAYSAASAASSDAVAKKRFLGRTVTVYELLGSGSVADLLLWKDWKKSAVFLATVTVLWFLFEISSFSLVTVIADVLMVLIVVVFLWVQFCKLTKKEGPKLPKLKLEPSTVMEFAEAFCNEVNSFLAIAQSTALGSDYILLGKVIAGLWLVSIFGTLFNGLTLTFITVLVAFTVPFFYDKYEDKVDEHLIRGSDEMLKYYKLAEDNVKSQAGQLQGRLREKLNQVQKKQQ